MANSIALGDTNIKALYLGSEKVSKVYLGETQIYPAYANLAITRIAVSDIAAAGGKVSSCTVYYTYDDGGEQKSGNTTVAFDEVEGVDLLTTEKKRTLLATRAISITVHEMTATGTANVYQEANLAVYGNVSTPTISAASDFPAGGVTLTAENVSTYWSVSASQTITYTSGHTRNGDITYAWTIPASHTISGLGTTFKKRTSVSHNALTVTATGEGNKTAKNTTATSHYQQANLISKIDVSASLSYANIGAGMTSASPTRSGSVTKFYFTSGSETTTQPDVQYGTLSRTTWVGSSTLAKSQNGFTAVNATTGVLTATSRGTTYDVNNRTSALVTGQQAQITWTHSATWGSGAITGTSGSPTATCTQLKNVITSVAVTASGGTIGMANPFGAGANNVGISTTSTAAGSISKLVAKFSSGSDLDITSSASTYGTSQTHYTWEISGTGFSIGEGQTGATTKVYAESRGTTFDVNARTATVKRNVEMVFVLNSSYNNGCSTGQTGKSSASTTATQAKNVIVLSATVSAGAIKAPTTYTAGGNSGTFTSTTAASISASGKFSSGSAATKDTHYTVSGLTYSWKSNKDYATFPATDKNVASIDVVMASRGSTYAEGARSATITRTASYTLAFKTGYSGEGNGTKTADATATATQAANTITLTFSVSAGTISGASFGAGAGTKSVANATAASATCTGKFASGAAATKDTHFTVAGPTYSWASDKDYATLTSADSASIDVSMPSRGTTKGDARLASISRTAWFTASFKAGYGGTGNGTKTAATAATVTQAANALSSVAIKNNSASAGAIKFNNNFGANKNSQTSVNTTAATAAANVTLVATYASGSTKDVTAASMSYSWASSQSYATLTSANTATISVEMSSRGTTYDTNTRSATITRYAAYSYTDGVTKSANVSCTATVTQAKNVITSLSDFTGGTSGSIADLSFGAGGATKSVVSKSAGTLATGATAHFSSGSTKAYTLSTLGTFGTLGYTYGVQSGLSWISNSGASITGASRGTTAGNERTAEFYRYPTAVFTLYSNYNDGCKTQTWTGSAAKGTATQAANTYTDSWNNPVVTVFTYSTNTFPYTGGTSEKPTLSGTQSGTRTYTSGSTSNLSNTNFTKSYTTDSLGFSVDADGIVTATWNFVASKRAGIITGKLTANGKSGTATFRFEQAKTPEQYYMAAVATQTGTATVGGVTYAIYKVDLVKTDKPNTQSRTVNYTLTYIRGRIGSPSFSEQISTSGSVTLTGSEAEGAIVRTILTGVPRVSIVEYKET